jgi:hypothetical protein
MVYPLGDPPANTTFILSTGTLQDGEPLSIYQYWFFWPGCALAPTAPLCLAGHQYNDWEFIYLYWKTTNPLSPVLQTVYTRFHFYFWKATPGSQVTLNNTQVIVSFSTSFHSPTVDTLPLSSFLKPANYSVSIPFVSSSVLGLNSWSYPVTNGGPHTLPLWQDPTSPPATGPNAYEISSSGNAAAPDPFSLYGTGRNIPSAALAGLVSGAAVYFFLLVVVIDIRGFERILKRRRRR